MNDLNTSSSLLASYRKVRYSLKVAWRQGVAWYLISRVSLGVSSTSGLTSLLPFRQMWKSNQSLQTGLAICVWCVQQSQEVWIFSVFYSICEYFLMLVIGSTNTCSFFVWYSAQKPIFSEWSLNCTSYFLIWSSTMVSIFETQTNNTSKLYSSPMTLQVISFSFTYSQPQIFSVLWQAMKAPSILPILTCMAYLRNPPLMRSQYSLSKLQQKPLLAFISQSRQSLQLATSQRMGAQALDLISKTQGLPFQSKPLQSIWDRRSSSSLTAAYLQQLLGMGTSRPCMRRSVSYFSWVRKYSTTWPRFSRTLLSVGMTPLSATMAWDPFSRLCKQKVMGFLKEAIHLLDLRLMESRMLAISGCLNELKMYESTIRQSEMLDVEDTQRHFISVALLISCLSSEGSTYLVIFASTSLESASLCCGSLPTPWSPNTSSSFRNWSSPCLSVGTLLSSS